MEITLGTGTTLITWTVDSNGQRGIVLRKVNERHEIDASTYIEPGDRGLRSDDIVIWLENIEGARVLQDRVNYECLKLLPRRPEDAFPGLNNGSPED